MGCSYKCGLPYFFTVLVDLDAIADELGLPFDRISLEMVYRVCIILVLLMTLALLLTLSSTLPENQETVVKSQLNLI